MAYSIRGSYESYLLRDPLFGKENNPSRYRDGGEKSEAVAALGDAPLSIAQREQLQPPEKESFLYMPELKDLPEFDAPAFLPDLDGASTTWPRSLVVPSPLATVDKKARSGDVK
jgi:hypothetical protein